MRRSEELELRQWQTQTVFPEREMGRFADTGVKGILRLMNDTEMMDNGGK